MEPGSNDCQPRLELCDEAPLGVVSPPPMWAGASSAALLELEVWLLLDDSVELLGPRGMLKASPLVDDESWLTLCSALCVALL
jgi:hypothetical protein